ncbi:MAG: hypothetical protein SO005_13540 [Candidatus Choladocola sp.]|nr:hypothetical protein [Candidatus Choladocola sp.]
MDKKELKKRGKGLLALVLAMLMMFGSSLTVLAAEYELTNESSLTVGTILEGGDTIKNPFESGALKVYIDNAQQSAFWDGHYHAFTLPTEAGFKYSVDFYSFEESYIGKVATVKLKKISAASDGSTTKAEPHTHYFEWVETIEPTETSDGLMEHKCACGAVDDSYVISGAMTFVKNIVKMIKEAPENGTVEITTSNFSCYTSFILKELSKRPDVSLKTTFKDKDGNMKTFTIPAGQAPTDGAQFYGFTYLGNLYGWN